MIIFELIAVVLVVIIVSGLNSRVKKIENELKSLTEQKKSLANTTSSSNIATGNIQNTPSILQTPIPATLNQSIPVSSQPGSVANNSQKTVPVSKEEASGRILGRIGITAVVIGVSFFLKYAFDNNWIGPSGRIMIGVIVGLILLVLGQYLRRKYIGYSDLLMGGGIGVLYLSIFSAYFFFQLVSSFAAGILMFIITALSFAISIVNATPTLAMVGVIGGFATPFMVSSGKNAMVELFTYLTILNLGIMGVSFFKKWPQLIVVAFVGTFVNFIGWYAAFYSTDSSLGMLFPTLLFCFTSFLIFLVASVARASVSKTTTDSSNYFILGANALAMAVIGYILLEPGYDNVLGYAAVFIAIIYMVVAVIVNKSNPSDKALNIFLPGLAVVFLSVAVPLQFSGPWIAVAWLIEAVFLYIIASTISNRGFQVMGVVVYCLGIFNTFAFNFPNDNPKLFTVFFNSHFVIVILAVVVAYAISYMYFRFGSLSVETQKNGIMVFLVIANFLSVYAFSSQIIFYHNAKSAILSEQYSSLQAESSRYNTGYDNSQIQQEARNKYYSESESLTNQSHTYVSIFWVLYAALLTIIGFGRRIIIARRFGLALFIITACKVFLDVWNLGQVYRIVSFIVFGVVALGASFFYVKFKDRLSEIV